MNDHSTTGGKAAREPGTTRARLVEVARQLFLKQGYCATGVAQILEKAGARSGSLYHYFTSKEDLLVAVLEAYKGMLWPYVLTPAFESVGDPVERIFAVLNRYREGLIITNCTQGCPIGNLALELSDTHPEVRRKIAENFEGWRLGIRQCLEEEADRLPPDLDCDRLATFILTVMEGGVMQARAHRSIEAFDASVAVLRDYFDRLLADR